MRRVLLLLAAATAVACSGEAARPPAPPAPEALVVDDAPEAPAPSAEERFPELAALVARAKRSGADLARADRELEALEEDGKHIDEYLEARGTPLPEMDADDLAERGAAVVPELLPLLDLPGDWIRDVVYETLAILGPEAASAVPTLVGILHDRGDPDRLLAADALFRIAPDTPGLTAPVVAWTGVPLDAMQEAWPDLEERLIAVLLDGDPEAKVGAARTAAQMEHPSRELLSALGRALAAGVPDAALALEQADLGDTATLHALVALLRSDRSGVSRAAKKLLEKTRANLAPVALDLARVAAEGDDSAAATAAKLLPAAGDESVVVPVLLDMLRSDRASWARAAAARALTTWPDTAPLVVPVLVEILPERMSVRGRHGYHLFPYTDWAATALGVYGPAAVEAAPALVKQLGVPEPSAARDALRKLGPAGIRALGAALDDPDRAVRGTAAVALSDAGAAAALVESELRIAAADGDCWLADYATLALCRMRPLTRDRAGEWARDLESGRMSPWVARRVVVDPVVETAAAQPFLRAAATCPDLETRMHAKLALRRRGEAVVRLGNDLGTAMLEDSPRVIYSALDGFEEFPDEVPRALPVILATLRTGDAKSRRHAAWILGELGPAASGALPALAAAAHDPDEGVARSAKEAIAKIHGD